MNYQKIYDDLIEKRRKNPLIKIRVNSKQKLYDGIYTETHHIIPKSINGTNDKENLIELTSREHFIAHKLLFKIYIGTPYETSMAYAFWEMCYCNKDKAYKINKTSKQFAREVKQARNVISKSQKNRIRINDGKHTKYVKPDELQQYLDNGYVFGTLQVPWNKGRHDLPSSWISGKHHTAETKAKISAKCKGLKLPPSAVEKLRKRMIGNQYCKGKKQSKETIENRVRKNANRIRINNGSKMKYVHQSDVQKFLNNGWTLGMLPLSNETKQKLSNSLKGRIPANKGKKMSDETRLKMSLAKRGKPPNNKGKHYKLQHSKE